MVSVDDLYPVARQQGGMAREEAADDFCQTDGRLANHLSGDPDFHPLQLVVHCCDGDRKLFFLRLIGVVDRLARSCGHQAEQVNERGEQQFPAIWTPRGLFKDAVQQVRGDDVFHRSANHDAGRAFFHKSFQRFSENHSVTLLEFACNLKHSNTLSC